MLDVEVLGRAHAPGAPAAAVIRRLCERTAQARGVQRGHVAVEFVGEQRIRELNAEHRRKDEPTDVLSFPIDGLDAAEGGEHSELGDIVICVQHTADVSEAIVHGMLHLLGMDHERDDGEMLALQRELLRPSMERSAGPRSSAAQ
jgi:probable rRNA maturation factor